LKDIILFGLGTLINKNVNDSVYYIGVPFKKRESLNG
tara:strand:- start:382 stop:492 length:111 start_codon:yes stop_codon:yes gene_type:complete